ncbi:MAG: hypothetical protein GTN93_33950, partial [Anaerolineae bacterium]|nr:hypothetical protein [Anaerolineae bacterium]
MSEKKKDPLAGVPTFNLGSQLMIKVKPMPTWEDMKAQWGNTKDENRLKTAIYLMEQAISRVKQAIE